MDVKITQMGEVSIINLTGEINIGTSPDLKKDFEGIPSKKIVINLEKITYVDSSGLATLVEILKKTRAKGGVLALASMPEKVKSLFEITKLDKLFSIYPSQAEALSKVK